MDHSSHFQDKDALAHVVEKRAAGILSLAESHGTEVPGMWAAFADTLRESGVMALILWSLFTVIHLAFSPFFALLASFLAAFAFWKGGRSAYLGWARLERLHTVIEQEKYEIEHHRDQEREELTALYHAKGFEGDLLTEVIDVLMSDEERLLKVMLEEELGLVLEAHEHPLKQGLGALLAALLSAAFILTLFFFFPLYGIAIASTLLLASGGVIAALFEKNRLIPTLIWNISLGGTAFGIAYFALNILL